MSRTPAPPRPAPPRPARARRRIILFASAATLAAAPFVFIGLVPGRSSGPGASLRPGDAEGPPPPGAAWAPPRPVPAVLPPAPAAAPEASRLPAPFRAPPPEIVARVTAEATGLLEAARADLVARCVPAARRGGGGPPAAVTFNVVFDAQGREVGRGISEDRRQRAPEVARCLRALPAGTLRVSPPGARVGVRVPMSFP